MNKKFGWAIGALVIALLTVGAYGATTVYADDSKPPQHPSGERGPGGPRGGHSLDSASLEAVAGALNMSTDEVTAALQEGKTLQELADDAGVDIQAVKDALSAAREASMRERIAQAVEDGTMSQDKADWLLEGLDKGFLDGPDFGLGHGFGGHPDKGTPPTTTTPTE